MSCNLDRKKEQYLRRTCRREAGDLLEEMRESWRGYCTGGKDGADRVPGSDEEDMGIGHTLKAI